MKYYYLLILLMACSCKLDKHSDNSTSKDKPQPAAIHTLESELLKKSFTESQIAVLATIKKDFDDHLHQKNLVKRELFSSYALHSHTLKTDFLSQIPINSTFPYDQETFLSKYADLNGFESVWSHKCGYVDKNGEILFNYYCLDTDKAVFSYLKELSKDNNLIKSFTDAYLEKGDFDIQTQQQVVLYSEDELNFKKLDHQVFWMIYHLSLKEAFDAKIKLETINQ